MAKLLEKMFVAIIGLFVPMLLVVPAVVGGVWGRVLVFPAWSPAFLLSILWFRRSFRRFEFELDRNVANQFGTERELQALEKMQSLDTRASPPKYISAR